MGASGLLMPTRKMRLADLGSRKEGVISRLALLLLGSVYEPRGLPPDWGWLARCQRFEPIYLNVSGILLSAPLTA
jgi:hypothetical protein